MFRLALACGRWDVDALVAEMSPEQWGAWVAYDRLEPIGERRGDLRNAMHLAHVLRMLAAMAGGDPNSIDERNFLPYLHELHRHDVGDADDPRLVVMAFEQMARKFNSRSA